MKQLYFVTIKISASISQNARVVICLLSEDGSCLRRCLRPEKQLAAHALPQVSRTSLGKQTKSRVVLWDPDSSHDGPVGLDLSDLPRGARQGWSWVNPVFISWLPPTTQVLLGHTAAQPHLLELVQLIALILLYLPLSLANKILIFFSSEYLYYLSRPRSVLILTFKFACSLSHLISYKFNPY